RLHLILAVPALDLLLDAANPQHRTVHIDQKAGRRRAGEPVESTNALTFVAITNHRTALGLIVDWRLQAVRLIQHDAAARRLEPKRHVDEPPEGVADAHPVLGTDEEQEKAAAPGTEQ